MGESTAQIKALVARPRGPMRLDAYLAGELAPEYSRSQILKAIKAGLVMMNQRPARASEPIRAGDRIEFRVPAPAAPIVAAAPAPGVDVLYQDADIIFVNKPPGMAVHPSAGHPHSTLVDALVARFPDLATVVEMDGSWRAGIVHRLDKDTSGVMVVARNSFARAALSAQFKQRSVEKIYLALALGHPGRERMTIDQPIGRHQAERKRMSVRSRTGRDAVSEVRVIQRCQLSLAGGARIAVSLLAVRPRTGRTHQIRVHLSAAGHPCLGDPLYGRQEREQLPIRRQALHAFYLAVSHPRSGNRIGIVAPIAPDLEQLLASCGLDSERIRAAVLGDSQGVGNRAGNAKIM